MRLRFQSFRGHDAALWPHKESEDRYFLNFEGVVEDHGQMVALVDGTVFLFEQMSNERESWFSSCDAHSQETTDVYEAMCSGNDYRDFVDTAGCGYDLLYVESVKVLPAYRGRGMGHAIMLNTIQTFGRGCAVVVIEPHPLRVLGEEGRELTTNFDKAMAWDQLAKTEAQYKSGAKKLASHWSKLGFEKVPKSKRFWYLEMCSFVVSEQLEAQIQEQIDTYEDDEDDEDEDDGDLVEGEHQ